GVVRLLCTAAVGRGRTGATGRRTHTRREVSARGSSPQRNSVRVDLPPFSVATQPAHRFRHIRHLSRITGSTRQPVVHSGYGIPTLHERTHQRTRRRPVTTGERAFTGVPTTTVHVHHHRPRHPTVRRRVKVHGQRAGIAYDKCPIALHRAGSRF